MLGIDRVAEGIVSVGMAAGENEFIALRWGCRF